MVLQVIYSRPFYLKVCIPPVYFFFFTGIDVTITYINTANKSCYTIYHDDLSVIAIIDPVGQKEKTDLVKRKDLNTSRS